MRYFISFSLLIFLLSSCYKGKSVDLIVHNAKIHTQTDDGIVHQAMAVKDGKIVEVGAERQILNKYSAKEVIDAAGKDVYPGFTDAHGHLLSYANKLLSLDLTDSKSFQEVLVRLEKYQSRYARKFIVGNGWDQSLWANDSFPTNEELNKLFPTIPVCLFRIDGHALLANDALLRLAKITPQSSIAGGTIEVKDKKCTGMLTDNAMLPIYSLLPKYPKKEIQSALKDIELELLQYGITGVHEAGIEFEHIDLFQELIDKKAFKLEVYAMLLNSERNIAFAKKQGVYQYKNLSIRSFKIFGDGALGSRGAFLKQPYSDKHSHFGVLTTPPDEMKKIAALCESVGYQMNTHAIGDSTNALMLHLYQRIFEVNKDHRWRIEHAQIVDPNDFVLFGKYAIFPSVQPTHATSDQHWAEKRVGSQRLKGAYAYKTLLNQFGMLAIGTDFPIESTDPFLTIHAAVQRKNAQNFPSSGYLTSESISLEQCIKGMTIWAAFAAFQENRLGTLEKGKDATFVIFERPVVSAPIYKPNFAAYTFIKGEKVYAAE